MDYEKKDFRKLYEELVRSDWFNRAYHNKSLGDCPFDIPELAESKDERMLNELILHFESIKEQALFDNQEETDNIVKSCNEKIAWLEKQKEEEGYEAIPVESTLEYKLGFKAGEESEKQKEQKPTEWTELTWKDIVELEGIINNVHYEFRNGIGQESFGKEVLEKFREYKGDEYLDETKIRKGERKTK